MKAYMNSRVFGLIALVVVAVASYNVLSSGYDKCMENASWSVCSR